jgi:ATP-dependent Clp protease ATP-binding subunit ClpX
MITTFRLGDVVEEARTARHPLLVAKLIGMYAGLLDAQLRKVVPVLRERGYTWTQIGTALGITKQSAWERFSGED